MSRLREVCLRLPERGETVKSLFRLVFGLAALFGGILWGTLSAAEMNVALTGLEGGFRGCY